MPSSSRAFVALPAITVQLASLNLLVRAQEAGEVVGRQAIQNTATTTNGVQRRGQSRVQKRTLFGPIWTLKAKLWRTRLLLDPAWTLISALVIHMLSRTRAVASPLQKPVQNMLLRQDFKIGL